MNKVRSKLGFMIKRLDDARNSGLYRSVREFNPLNNARISINGKELINFCSNDYLGLGSNRILQERALDFMKKYGNGSGASRLVCGDRPVQFLPVQEALSNC